MSSIREIKCFEHEVDAIPVNIFRVKVVNKSYKTFVINFSSFSFANVVFSNSLFDILNMIWGDLNLWLILIFQYTKIINSTFCFMMLF